MKRIWLAVLCGLSILNFMGSSVARAGGTKLTPVQKEEVKRLERAILERVDKETLAKMFPEGKEKQVEKKFLLQLDRSGLSLWTTDGKEGPVIADGFVPVKILSKYHFAPDLLLGASYVLVLRDMENSPKKAPQEHWKVVDNLILLAFQNAFNHTVGLERKLAAIGTEINRFLKSPDGAKQ